MPVRQLAAIMFADIVGYTSIMEEDEGRALRLLEKFKTKLEAEVTRHHGRILEFRGDGVLCDFRSTLEGVRAALEIQIAMQHDPRVPLRISLHTGDVIIEGDAIYGDGVNIASRIETLAVPGSVFISGKVYDDIKNQKGIQTVSLGEYMLKNVRESISLYALSHPGIVVPDASHPEGKGMRTQIPCILVLPFLNLSNDPTQEYFSDGLTEELIANLSHLHEVKVISRTTSMKYKGTTKDIKTIASETGASYIMEGSVRSQSNKLRITAQIIDAKGDLHLWADHFQGSMDDVFDIQEKVAAKIADALHLQLTRDEKDNLQKRYTINMEAYQLYLQGRFFWNKRNQDSILMAISFFEKAIEKDPGYALAWAGIADAYNILGEFTDQSRQVLHPKAKAAVHKALQLDSKLAEAHVSLASLLMINEWDWDQADREFQIGLSLNPNYATGRHWYSELLLFQGKEQEAIDEIALAVELDPVSMAILKDQGIIFYYTRQYSLGIEKALTSLVLDPDFVPAHRLLSLCYTEAGRYEDALKENEIWGRLIRNPMKSDLIKAYILARSGKVESARQMVSTFQEDQLGANDVRSLALVHAALGEIDEAFKLLEISFARHEEALCSLRQDPKMDPLRSDPRFNDLVLRIGLIP